MGLGHWGVEKPLPGVATWYHRLSCAADQHAHMIDPWPQAGGFCKLPLSEHVSVTSVAPLSQLTLATHLHITALRPKKAWRCGALHTALHALVCKKVWSPRGALQGPGSAADSWLALGIYFLGCFSFTTSGLDLILSKVL